MCCYSGSAVSCIEHRQSRFSIIFKGSRIFRMVNTGFNIKSPGTLASNKKSPPVLWSFSYQSPTRHLLPVLGCYVYTENRLFNVATFIKDGRQIFWITCCSFTMSIYCFILHFQKWQQLLPLNLKNLSLLTANFSSAASSFPQLSELKRARALFWIRFWLKGMLLLIWSSVQAIKTLFISATRLFCFPLCLLLQKDLF